MYSSTIDRQLDLKRRIVLPAEFRAVTAGPFDGVFCFPSIEADCIEGGGQALFQEYDDLIKSLPLGDPLRSAMETTIIGGMAKLSWDPAGRITLPDNLCAMFGLTDWVSVVGLGSRFQIWSKSAFAAHREKLRLEAREGLMALRLSQRPAALAAAS